MRIYTKRILDRLVQLSSEIMSANSVDYYDRLRALKRFCDATPALALCLAQLPRAPYDFTVDWRDLADHWPEGEEGYAYRWDAITQAVGAHSNNGDLIFVQMRARSAAEMYNLFTRMFVVPLCNYLIDRLEVSSIMLYLLLRYKRWAEWFEAVRLRETYEEGGEAGLDIDLRRFLFESGIDYPYSQPHSPGGRADVVARLETDDPLVLEIKVWDSKKGYKENRVRDGLRQVMDYAAKYGKDKGYVAVFNVDPESLVFVGETSGDEWPARIEKGRIYYFIGINIAEQEKPVSERDKGKPVKTNDILLGELWDSLTEVSKYT